MIELRPYSAAHMINKKKKKKKKKVRKFNQHLMIMQFKFSSLQRIVSIDFNTFTPKGFNTPTPKRV